MARVLFVDHQSETLSKMRAAMRTYRRDWTMTFCAGANEALEVLASQSYDVVIAELQMPGMDGKQLLTLVSKLYPHTMRIATSRQSEYEAMVDCVGTAHQFLSKPCDPELLFQTISKSTHLASRLGNDRLQALAMRMQSLPSLPTIYQQLISELQKEESSVHQIGKLISRDVGMTAKILQLVNSSYFGLPVHVVDASHAAALLGLNMLKPLVLSAGIFRQMEDSRVPIHILEETLEHCMAVGCLARDLAESETKNQELVDNTMLAGVLHDVGKLVLADNFANQYTSLASKSAQAGLPLRVMEVEQYGATHASIGGYLLGLWGLPHCIMEAVTYHHDPSASGCNTLAPLVFIHAANALILTEEADEAGNPSAEFDMVYLRQLGLDQRLETWREIAREARAAAC
jgi:HD-like signal output (HDOD) protein